MKAGAAARAPVSAAGLLMLAAAARAANLAPASGIYGATLGAGAGTAAERSAFGQNPASLRPASWGFRLDYHRPFGLGELEVAEAGLFLDGSRAGLACDWRMTEITGFYDERGFRAAPSFRLFDGPRFPGILDFGYAFAAWRSALAGEAPAWESSQETGLAWRPWPRLAIGAFAAGIPLRPSRAFREAPGRVAQFGLEVDSHAPAAPGKGAAPGQSLRLDFRRTGDGPWRTLASLSARPCPGLEATLGLSARPFQAAAGLSLAWRGFRVRQSVRYHRYLGRTWLSGADYAH